MIQVDRTRSAVPGDFDMPPVSIQRLLAGPSLDSRPGASPPTSPASDASRPMPRGRSSPRSRPRACSVVAAPGFPVGTKWRGLADRWSGSAVVVANGAEGEPASRKDRRSWHRGRTSSSTARCSPPRRSVHAEVVFYVGCEHGDATVAMRRAIDARRATIRQSMRFVAAPIGYVAGEATAAVHYINAADARPLNTPPRMSEAGIDGRPTLVQNVESLAYAALIARFGDAWYRTAGRDSAAGTALVTVSGAVSGRPSGRSSSGRRWAMSSSHARPLVGRRPLSSSAATSGPGRGLATSGPCRCPRRPCTTRTCRSDAG